MQYEVRSYEDLLCNARHMMYADFPKVSDIGQVWGWGYGGEGQLGLGSRIRMVSSPHPVPCIESSAYGKDRSATMSRGGTAEGPGYRAPGSYVKGIACGGRHSAVITGRSVISSLFLFLSSSLCITTSTSYKFFKPLHKYIACNPLSRFLGFGILGKNIQAE